MRILVIEDEHRIAEALKRGLIQEGYAVDVAYSGTDGYDMAVSESYDLGIFDVMLPGLDGVEVTKKLRSENVHTPILLLTAKSQVGDRVLGLNSGADDYLPKPFAFEELLARVRALLRRPITELPKILESGDIKLDTLKRIVYKNNNVVNLSVKEYGLIEYLMRNLGTRISKEQITAHVWDYDADILPNTVEAYVGRVRSKLGNKSIITIRGFGYQMDK